MHLEAAIPVLLAGALEFVPDGTGEIYGDNVISLPSVKR